MKRYWVLTVSSLPVAGMAIFPFIILCRQRFAKDKVLINHERIHLRQQVEMLLVPFYIAYLLNYLVNLIKYRNHHEAYINISFEREAYEMDKNFKYLEKRAFWAWTKYLRK